MSQTPVEPQPLILDNASIELNGVELRCLVNHVELNPDVATIDVVTMCGTKTYPGNVTWHLLLTLVQSFDDGGTDEVLAACLAADGPVPYKIRPFFSKPISERNPSFEGFVIPQPYQLLGGDAGALSTIDIDWTMTGPPERVTDGTSTMSAAGPLPTGATPTSTTAAA